MFLILFLNYYLNVLKWEDINFFSIESSGNDFITEHLIELVTLFNWVTMWNIPSSKIFTSHKLNVSYPIFELLFKCVKMNPSLNYDHQVMIS